MDEFVSTVPVVVKEDDGTYTVKFRGRWITGLTAAQSSEAYEMGASAYKSGQDAFKATLQRLLGVRP